MVKEKTGIIWNGLNIFYGKGVSLLLRISLTYFLVPEELGLFTTVLVYFGLASAFTELGFEKTLVQRLRDRETASLHHLVFWLVLFLSVALAVVFATIGGWLLEMVYGDPRLPVICAVMSVGLILKGLATLPVVFFTRMQRFRAIALADCAGLTLGIIFALYLAYGGYGVWSLVANHIIWLGVKLFVLWWQLSWRPRKFKCRSVSKNDSANAFFTFGNQLFDVMRLNFDYLVAGIFLGTKSLGVYTIAFLITETARISASQMITRGLFPIFAQDRRDNVRFIASYRRGLNNFVFAVLPLSSAMVFFSEPLIHATLLEEWHAIVLPVKVLAASGVVYGLLGPVGEALYALGYAKTLFKVNILTFISLGAPAIVYGAHDWGMVGVAAGAGFALLSMRFIQFLYLRFCSSVINFSVYKYVLLPTLACGMSYYVSTRSDDLVMTTICVALHIILFLLAFFANQRALGLERQSH